MGKNWNHHAKRGGNRGNSHFRPPKDHIQLCFCVSYSGFAFRGLQLQAHEPTHHTVEGTFVCALLDAGVILDVQQGHIHDAHNFFSRSCRTDRGVHAMRNVVSLFIPKRRWDETFQSSTAVVQERVQAALQRRLQMYPPEEEDETESATQEEGQQKRESNNNKKRTTMMMTVHTVTQVMSSFSPKNNCTRRVYHYWLPLYALHGGGGGGADGWEGLFRAFPDLREACNFLKEETEGTRGGTTNEEHFVDLDATASESLSPSDTTVLHWTTAWRQQLAKANADVLRKFVGTHRFHNYTADPADVRGGGSVNGKAISPLDDEALRTISRCAIQPRVYFVPVRKSGAEQQQKTEGNSNNTDPVEAENHRCAVEGPEGSPTLDSVLRCVSMIRRSESNQVEQRTLSDRLAALCRGVVPAVTEDVAQQLCGCVEGGRFLPGAVPVKFADAARSLPSHLPFVLFQVEGNSFLLNMIRKLVGMLLAVLRGARPTLVEDSLLPSSRIAVPMAPGGYLMLSCSMYHSYDAQVRANREAANARRRLRDEQQRIATTTNATTEQGEQREGDEVPVAVLQRATDVPVPPPHTGPAYQPLDEAWDEADVSAQARSFLFQSLLSDVVKYDLNLMPPLDTLFYLRDAAFASLALPIATAPSSSSSSCATTATAAAAVAKKEGPVPSLNARLDAHLVEMKEFSPSRPPLSGHPNASEMTIFLRMLRVHLWNIRPVAVPPESKAEREMAKRAAAAAAATAADTATAKKEEEGVPRSSTLPLSEPPHRNETEQGDSVAAAVSLLPSSSRKRRREEQQDDMQDEQEDGEGDDGDDAAVLPPCFDDGWWYHCPTLAEEAVPRRAVFLARYRSSMAYTVALRNQNKTRQLLRGLTTTTNVDGGEEEEDVDVMTELPPCGGDE